MRSCIYDGSWGINGAALKDKSVLWEITKKQKNKIVKDAWKNIENTTFPTGSEKGK